MRIDLNIKILLEHCSKMNHLKLRSRMLATVDRVASLKTHVATGGRLNVFNALEEDDIPPAVVSGLKIESKSLTSLTLSFKKTGDDGSEGEASEYFVRYASEPIETEADWQEAIGLEVSLLSENLMQVSGFEMESEGFLALRAQDNVGNLSDLSSSLSFSASSFSNLTF